jgi:diguanylate cyclase (GGDEF)-like protein
MISLKKYLETTGNGSKTEVVEPEGKSILPSILAAYRSALMEMGNCSLDACPALGDKLKRALLKLEETLALAVTPEALAETEREVQEKLQDWGKRTAVHYRQKAGEVKEILILMARTAESVGERDQRCAKQISDVTTRLRKVADLEDLSQIRRSIEESAAELKTSVERMTTEGKAVIAQLRTEVSNYQAKLEEAELVATVDSLTGLRNRHYVETQIERRLDSVLPFCVAIVDIDNFKKVNDDHGHLIGDDLLKKFASELKLVCRSTDLIGRWGGDEFIILLDSGLTEAKAQIDRIRKTVCGSYSIQRHSGPMNLIVEASIGLAERVPKESLKDLLARADEAMYRHKESSRAKAGRPRR